VLEADVFPGDFGRKMLRFFTDDSRGDVPGLVNIPKTSKNDGKIHHF